MDFPGTWQIRINDGGHTMLLALWMRDVERIPVPESPLVPGPLDVGPLPDPSTRVERAPRLAAEWMRWWTSIVDMSPRPPRLPPDESIEPAMDTPDPIGLARTPELRAVVARRHGEYHEWNVRRIRREVHEPDNVEGLHRDDRRHLDVVRGVESSLGRAVKPFTFRFHLIPVRDSRIIPLTDTRFLVPLRFYHSDGWPTWLDALVRSFE